MYLVMTTLREDDIVKTKSVYHGSLVYLTLTSLYGISSEMPCAFAEHTLTGIRKGVFRLSMLIHSCTAFPFHAYIPSPERATRAPSALFCNVSLFSQWEQALKCQYILLAKSHSG